MRISITRFNVFSFKVAKFKKITALAIILTIATISGYSAFKHFAIAQNGNFADNVKTFMEMISKKDDGSEKTEFYSGEDIIMNSRVEVSSEGLGKSYPNAYFILKIPKKYINYVKKTATDAVSDIEDISNNDYHIFKAKYKNLQAGSINSINYIFKLQDPETPENYKLETTHELYSEDGTLLSKQSKVLNTLKHSNDPYLTMRRDDEVNVARYRADNSIEAFFSESRDVHFNFRYNERNKIYVGRKELSNIRYEITLPEYLSMSPKSTENGWKFDDSSRKIFFDTKSTQIPDLWIKYNKKAPLSLLNKKEIITINAILSYTDGSNTNLSANSTITPRVIPYSTEKYFSLDKYYDTSNWAKVNYENGSFEDKRNYREIFNINKSNPNGEIEWVDRLWFENNGNKEFESIDYIEDTLNDNDRYISSVNGDEIVPSYFEKLDIYAKYEDGTEVKVGELTKDSRKIDLPKGIKSIKAKIPENIKSNPPRFGDQVILRLKTTTKFYDLEKYKASLQPEKKYPIESVVKLKLKNEETEKQYESLVATVKKIITVDNAHMSFGDPGYIPTLTKAGQSVNDDVYIDITYEKSIKNPTYGILSSDKFTIGEEAQKCIDDGKCSLIENFKNTGKRLFKISYKATNGDQAKLHSLVNDSIRVSETTPSGQYEFKFLYMWDSAINSEYRSNDLDDLDYDEDGNINSDNVDIDSHTAEIRVLKPEQVAVKKYVRKHNPNNIFKTSLSQLNPADLIDYRFSVLNISDKPLRTSKILEVLPTSNDKKIVENNRGFQEYRGSQFPVRMTGPLKERNGFKIKYSTEEPGLNQNESWNKNFIDKDTISDWSKVRMIKIEQEKGFEIPAQTVENFDFTAQIDSNALDNTVARNTVATTISASGNLVESDPAEIKVKYPAVVEGVAFEDTNKNNVYDENIDTLLPNYTVELFKDGENTPSQTAKTDAQGHYRFITKDFTTYKVKFTKDNAIETVVGGDNLNEKASHVATNSTDLTIESSTFRFTDNNKHYVRNIGVFRRRGSVEAKFVDQNNNELQNKVTVKDNALISEIYIATKPNEITKDNLVYVFEKLKDGSAPETGNVEENTQTVTFVYKPKEGGKVEAKFVKSGTNQEISTTETVKPAGIQVGTEYTATSKPEIVENGLKYVYDKVAANSAPQNGRVKAEAQNVIFEYIPKSGKPVYAISKIVGTNEIIKNVTVATDGTQVGTPYSNTPTPEITHNGITYVYNSVLKDSAPSIGNVSEQEQTILYGYVPKKGGQVLAKYLDQNGNAIKNTKIVKATDTPVGTNYGDEPDLEITTGNGLVYTFEKIKSGSKTGKVEANSKEIVYQYKPKLGKGVKVRLITSKDKAILGEIALEKDGKQIGTMFSYTNPKEVTNKKGLVYEAEANAKAVNGKISGESQIFEISYKPKKGGKIEAKFINQDGEEIQNAVEIAKAETQVGTDYSSQSPKEITKDGLVYIFEKIAKDSAPEIGKVKAENQTITYIYTPKKGGSVIERFVDQNGNSIQPNNILHKVGTQVGTPFESNGVNRIEINGRIYELKKVEGRQKGNVKENEIFINYIFEDVTKISAPNTGVLRNISIFIIALATVILSIITARAFKKRITF